MDFIEERDLEDELLRRIRYALSTEEKHRHIDRVECEGLENGRLILRRENRRYAVSVREEGEHAPKENV